MARNRQSGSDEITGGENPGGLHLDIGALVMLR